MKALGTRKHVTPKWVDRILYTLIILAVISFACFGRPMVLQGEGDSMSPTLRDGGQEVVLRLWLFFRHIKPGHIYSFFDPDGELCLKRAYAVEGDWVWFLGDNQSIDKDGKPRSTDSRKFGWISRNNVVGIHLATLPRFCDGPTLAQNCQVGDPRVHKSMTREEFRQMRAEQQALINLKYTEGGKIRAQGSTSPEVFDDDDTTYWVKEGPVRFSTTQPVRRIVTRTQHPDVNKGRVKLTAPGGKILYSTEKQGESEIRPRTAIPPGRWEAVGESCTIVELELYSR